MCSPQAGLSNSDNSENTWTSCFHPSLSPYNTKQPDRHLSLKLQILNWHFLAVCYWSLVSAAARSSLLILLDLSEDFSIVNHWILLSTLWTMGIIALVWVLAYRYSFYGFLEENNVTWIIHRVRCSAPSSSQYIPYPLSLSLPLQCQQQLLSFFLFICIAPIKQLNTNQYWGNMTHASPPIFWTNLKWFQWTSARMLWW